MEQKTPAVSVIINCHNSAPFLRETIGSVFAQTFTDWEIVAWDDASEDETPQIAKSYGEKVRYFRGEKAASLGQARNYAFKEARGKYVAFLDHDDLWLPRKLERQVALFEKSPEVGLVYTQTVFFNNSGDHHLAYREKPPEGLVFRDLINDYPFVLSSVMIRKEAVRGLQEVFDDRFHFIEEMDLFLRILHDWRAAYLEEPLTKYRMHEKSFTFSHGLFYPEEKELLVQKLISLYPHFSEEYTNELLTLESQIAYEEFLKSWREGDAKRARRLARQSPAWNKKLKIVYALSRLMPFSFYVALRRLIKRRFYSV